MLVIPGLTFLSWIQDGLPEVLWAALLISELPRQKALDIFRSVAEIFAQEAELRNKEKDFPGITHSTIGCFPNAFLERAFAKVFSDEKTKDALRPLLIFEDLPNRTLWEKVIGKDSLPEEDLEKLRIAVAKTIGHQTEAATDCRWLKVLFLILSRKMNFAGSMSQEVDEIIKYPHLGDLRSVRPRIRASEIGTRMQGDKSSWSETFWNQMLREAPCLIPEEEKVPKSGKEIDQEILVKFHKETIDLTRGFFDAQTTTAVDAKHNTIFGIGLYAGNLIKETMFSGVQGMSLSRLTLRSLAESLITLKYLIDKDDQELWDDFRVYGAGQAKILEEKFRDSGYPEYLSELDLNEIANEDAWVEFVPVNVGHWGGTDLRAMSQETQLKEVYEKYYRWPSTYSHANWGAIRDSALQMCVNPLHRYHKIPRTQIRVNNSAVPDMLILWELILEQIERVYPGVIESKKSKRTTSAPVAQV